MRRYQVSKHFKVTLVIFLAGLLFFILYLMSILRYAFSVEVNEFNIGTLKKNQYVDITAKECVTYLREGTQKGYTNTTGGAVGLGRDYTGYTQKIGENAYIAVEMEDPRLIKEIEAWPFGKGSEPITFKGQVKGTKLHRTVAEGILTEVSIFQVTKEEVETAHSILSFIGGIGICVSLVMYLTFAGIKVVYVRPLEDSKRYKDYYLGRVYRMELDLEREKKNLEEIRAEQEKHKKNLLIGIGACVVSLLATLVIGYLWLSGVLAITGLCLTIISAYVHLWSILFTWDAFLNLDHPLAYKISDLFLLRTCSIKREEASKYISVISKRLEQDKQEEEQRRQKQEEMGVYFNEDNTFK